MTKRIKEVFNKDQVCHIWANQSQAHARTSGNKVFFNDTRIYSYGSHYLAGEIHTSKNDMPYALVNNYAYSVTTGTHLSSIRSALSGKMTYFSVPNPDRPTSQENIDYMNQKVWDVFGDIVNMRNKQPDDFSFTQGIEQLNNFFDCIDMPKLKIDTTKISDSFGIVNECNTAKLERIRANNTPEKLAEKQALKAKKQASALATIIADFRAFKRRSVGNALSYDLLRVNEARSIVETSRGADVPLDHAIRLLERIKSGQVKSGDRIGHFTLNGVLYDQDMHETVIKIGCHTILRSEADAVLSNLEPKLKLAE